MRNAKCGMRNVNPNSARRSPHPALQRGQASLEMTLALGGVLLLLLGSFKVFLWINERLVRRHQYYNCTRVAAGSSAPGVVVWDDPAVHIPLKIFEAQMVSADPCL